MRVGYEGKFDEQPDFVYSTFELAGIPVVLSRCVSRKGVQPVFSQPSFQSRQRAETRRGAVDMIFRIYKIAGF